jgi:hypothetical protein
VNSDGYLSLKEMKSGFRALFTMMGTDNSEAVLKKLSESSMDEMKVVSEDINLRERKQSIIEGRIGNTLKYDHKKISKGKIVS